MKDVFLEEFGIKCDYDLDCNTSDKNVIYNKTLKLFKQILPKFVLVYGDTNSSLAVAIAAKEIKAKLVHIEAGLRCFDLTVPEEKNRIVIDSLADYHFVPTEFNKICLKMEGTVENVHVTGNLIVDVVKERKEKEVEKKEQNEHLPKFSTSYILLTLHRRDNVDDVDKLLMLKKHLETLNDIVIFPIHPHTKKNLKENKIEFSSNVKLIEPLNYKEFIYALQNCKLVLTDSGGVQEESIILKKPCITLRSTTERQETILLGANTLFPLYRKDSLNKVVETMSEIRITKQPYGENVSNNMVKLIINLLERNNIDIPQQTVLKTKDGRIFDNIYPKLQIEVKRTKNSKE